MRAAGVCGTETGEVSGIIREGDASGDGPVDPLESGYVLARFGCPVGEGDESCARLVFGLLRPSLGSIAPFSVVA